MILSGCAVMDHPASDLFDPLTVKQGAQSTRQIPPRYLVFISKDEKSVAISADWVARAVADSLVVNSHYVPFRETGQEYQGSCIGGCEHFNRGPATTLYAGIRATAQNNRVLVEYLKGKERPGADSGLMRKVAISTTKTTLTVSRDPNQIGGFIVTSSGLSETLSKDLVLLVNPPLDSIEKITADLIHSMEVMQPKIPEQYVSVSESDSPYPPGSVLANYERIFGRNCLPIEIMGDTKTVSCSIGDSDAPAKSFRVTAYPYHQNQSKVKISFTVAYELRSNGENSFQAQRVAAMAERLKKVASD